MSKASAPAAPDYTPIAAADTAAANDQYQLGEQQLQQAQSEYAAEAPATNAYMQSMTALSNSQAALSDSAENEYTSVFQPLQTQFASQAENYDSTDNQNQQAGAADADVANQFDSARTTAQQSLESYGIDPSQTRFGALDLGSQVQQAAATASAGTTSRLNTANTGLALEGQALNLGNNVASTSTGAAGSSASTGGSGINATTNEANVFGNLEGTPAQYEGLANNSNAGAASALNLGYNNALAGQQLQVQESGNNMSGIGSLVGAAATVGAIAI